jgi:DNA-binding transcriptional regulator YdaS (Cro superfamily)
MNAIKHACEILGSQKALASALGVTPGAVSQWAEGRVPFEHVIKIEQLTHGAVRCEQLRPDIDWPYLRATDCPITEPDKLAA